MRFLEILIQTIVEIDVLPKLCLHLLLLSFKFFNSSFQGINLIRMSRSQLLN